MRGGPPDAARVARAERGGRRFGEKRPAAYGKELFSVQIQGASGSPLRAIALAP